MFQRINSFVGCFFSVQLNKRNTETFHVSGILDFGDVQFNYYVFELSIVICYMMIECKLMDILDAPGHVLAGYNRLRHIPDAEFDLLKVAYVLRIPLTFHSI